MFCNPIDGQSKKGTRNFKLREYNLGSVWECFGVWLQLFFKLFFMPKYIKIIFFFIFLKSFLRSAHQNDPKHTKNFNF
jgi:hypothetical protein